MSKETTMEVLIIEDDQGLRTMLNLLHVLPAFADEVNGGPSGTNATLTSSKHERPHCRKE